MDITAFISYFAAWFGIVSAVFILGDRIEKVLSAESKNATSQWLRSFDVSLRLHAWSHTLENLLNAIFGPKHLSRKCFERSCIMSVGSVWILLFLWYSFHAREFLQGIDKLAIKPGFIIVAAFGDISVTMFIILSYLTLVNIGQRKFKKYACACVCLFILGICVSGYHAEIVARLDRLTSDSPVTGRILAGSALLLCFACFPVVLNLIPDYLSLLETRCVIRWIRRRPSVRRVTCLMFFDIVASGIIYIAFTAIAIAFVGTTGLHRKALPEIPVLQVFWKNFYLTIVDILRYGTRLQSGIPLPLGADRNVPIEVGVSSGITFYSTFSTSVWLWLCTLGGTLASLASVSNICGVKMKALLDLDNKPISSIAFCMNLLVTLLFLIGLLARWITTFV